MNAMLPATVVAACLSVAVLAAGQNRPSLPNADRLGSIIHAGLFPDKPRNMSFVQYFGQFTILNDNLTRVLESLEFGVLDSENLNNAIKLAEDARRLHEVSQNFRRTETPFSTQAIFSYKEHPYAWSLEQRNRLFQFCQHSVYSSRYEIGKLRSIRQKFRNSTVYRIGVYMGNNLELKETAGRVYSTIQRMSPHEVNLLWYVFNYHTLLNLHFDMISNTEMMFLLMKTIDDSLVHFPYWKGQMNLVPALPADSVEATSMDPGNMYKKKK